MIHNWELKHKVQENHDEENEDLHENFYIGEPELEHQQLFVPGKEHVDFLCLDFAVVLKDEALHPYIMVGTSEATFIMLDPNDYNLDAK